MARCGRAQPARHSPLHDLLAIGAFAPCLVVPALPDIQTHGHCSSAPLNAEAVKAACLCLHRQVSIFLFPMWLWGNETGRSCLAGGWSEFGDSRSWALQHIETPTWLRICKDGKAFPSGRQYAIATGSYCNHADLILLPSHVLLLVFCLLKSSPVSSVFLACLLACISCPSLLLSRILLSSALLSLLREDQRSGTQASPSAEPLGFKGEVKA